MTRKAAGRELVNTGTNRRFVRRAAAGFNEPEEVANSLTADRRTKGKIKAKLCPGDRGDASLIAVAMARQRPHGQRLLDDLCVRSAGCDVCLTARRYIVPM
jgi:phosphoserine phosphatase